MESSPGEEAAKPLAAVQDCISTSVRVKPCHISERTLAESPAVFVWTKT